MSKTALKIVVGVVLAVLLLGVGLKVLKVASTLIWWLIMIPLLGSILGLAISYLIKRVILPKGSPHRENPACLLYTSPSPRDRTRSRMPSSA